MGTVKTHKCKSCKFTYQVPKIVVRNGKTKLVCPYCGAEVQ